MANQNQLRRPGDLNPAFNGGKVTLDHTGNAAFVLRLEQTTDANLLVLSRSIDARGYFLSQFTPQGERDPSFADGAGFVHVVDPISQDRDRLHVLKNGSFFVTGGSNSELLSASRFHADGRLDSSYGEDGHAVVRVSELIFDGRSGARIHTPEHKSAQEKGLPPKTGNLISIADGDSLYLVFTVGWGAYDELLAVVVRLDNQGKLDWAFNGSGYVAVTLAGTLIPFNYAVEAALQTEGAGSSKLVILVKESLPFATPYEGQQFLLRYDAKGKQDPFFGGNGNDQGFVRIDKDDFYVVNALWVDENGALKVLGASVKDGIGLKAAIRGYTAEGQVDTSFNRGELLLKEIVPGYGNWHGGAFYGQGKEARMVLSTSVRTDVARIAVVRLVDDGNFDETFGEQGIAAFDAEDSGVLVLAQLQLLPNEDIILGFKNDIWWLLGGAATPPIMAESCPAESADPAPDTTPPALALLKTAGAGPDSPTRAG